MNVNTGATAPPRSRLSTAEASRYTGVAESTLRYYRHNDIGPASYAIGGRKVFYDIADLDSWIAAEKAKTIRGGAQ